MATATEQTVPTRPSLLDRIKDWRNDESWREFCTNYRSLIYGFALKRGLSESDAEDIVQETFVSVAKGIQEFQYDPRQCAFKTWLMNLTSRRIADLFRKRSREVQVSIDTHEPGRAALLNSVPDPNATALTRQWDEEWDKNLLEVALEHLKKQVDPKQFGVFYLHVIKAQSVRQVAKSLGVNVAYVYLVKHRLKPIFEKAVKTVRREWVSTRKRVATTKYTARRGRNQK